MWGKNLLRELLHDTIEQTYSRTNRYTKPSTVVYMEMRQFNQQEVPSEQSTSFNALQLKINFAEETHPKERKQKPTATAGISITAKILLSTGPQITSKLLQQGVTRFIIVVF